MAAVVTHRRPRLAGDLVRHLVDVDGFHPSEVILVVNGEGGLDDQELQATIDTVQLPENTGPAGGFHEALRRGAAHPSRPRWVYACEDDVHLFDLPPGRLRSVVAEAEELRCSGRRIGAIFSYARDLDRRTGVTVPHRPSSPNGFDRVDVGCWGATLVSREVVNAGVLPDPTMFFGYEDFDYWLRVAKAGFELVVDNATASAVITTRDEAFAGERPLDSDEGWRAYYVARNFLELARRHGHAGWTVAHLVKSMRRLSLARSSAERRAIATGLKDGSLRRLGPDPRFMRTVGEL